ncbi:MAG: hypothetical protein IJF71_06075 [Clostridia bacterium]|nr:hypothetical protein [Clostridia bacterium]
MTLNEWKQSLKTEVEAGTHDVRDAVRARMANGERLPLPAVRKKPSRMLSWWQPVAAAAAVIIIALVCLMGINPSKPSYAGLTFDCARFAVSVYVDTDGNVTEVKTAQGALNVEKEELLGKPLGEALNMLSTGLMMQELYLIPESHSQEVTAIINEAIDAYRKQNSSIEVRTNVDGSIAQRAKNLGVSITKYGLIADLYSKPGNTYTMEQLAKMSMHELLELL